MNLTWICFNNLSSKTSLFSEHSNIYVCVNIYIHIAVADFLTLEPELQP